MRAPLAVVLVAALGGCGGAEPGEPDAVPPPSDAAECADDQRIRLFPDGDGDGYGDRSSAGELLCSARPGWVVDRTDCADGDPAAHPLQTVYSASPVVGGTPPHDRNCDAVEERRWPVALPSCSSRPQGSCGAQFNAWPASVPACGEVGPWVGGCAWNGEFCQPTSTEDRAQECR